MDIVISNECEKSPVTWEISPCDRDDRLLGRNDRLFCRVEKWRGFSHANKKKPLRPLRLCG